jgi:phytoene/squalene synthetase
VTTLAWVVFALAALPAAVALLNALAIRTPKGGRVPDGALVSVLIPARDEAANIRDAVGAALATRGVPVEVVVMDDGSTDGTDAIVADLAARDPRVRLERAPPLPPGWGGKAHACQRAAEAARGTHLLFADADVRLAPDAAERMLSCSVRGGRPFVSAVPRQVTGTVGEMLAVPTINLLIRGYFPAFFMRLSGHAAFAVGCGQLMLVERAAYLGAGGHGAVKGTRHDGMALARSMRRNGVATDLVDGSRLATCRMYRGFGETWDGFAKNATEGMATPVGIWVWTALLGLGHVAPPVLALLALLGLAPALPAVGALALSFGVRAGVTWATREDWRTVPLHPVTVAVALAIQWAAITRPMRGVSTAWKGRGYQGETGVETPTRTHRDENFPVASLLAAPRLRPAILAFYRFVRAADDVADDPRLGPAEKLRRLDAMEAALVGAQTAGSAQSAPLAPALSPGGRGGLSAAAIIPPSPPGGREGVGGPARDDAGPLAAALAAADRAHGAGVAEARLLLDAFRQDATVRRYGDWAGLEDYCRRSADPVGRFLLRLNGEDEALLPAADALCTALQILNHLQDLVPDRDRLDRVYLPVPWMDLAGGEAAFFDPARVADRRPVLDAALDRVEELLDVAEALPRGCRDRRLAAEAAATLALARRLAARLSAADPVAGRVALSKADMAAGLARGLGVLAGRAASRTDAAVARRIVSRASSSFGPGMASLPPDRRRAIHAVYAFCRRIDDVADGAMPPAEKRRFLADWRAEVGRIGAGCRTPVGRELEHAAAAFDLDAGELHALLDGMETDAAPRVRMADDAALDLYCRRVAGAVGLLSIRIFGAPEADAFARALGRTLQLVNVLRDVDDDAARDRLYVPLSRLGDDGTRHAEAIVAEPRFAKACADLAEEAAAGFAACDRLVGSLDRRRLRPAVLMMEAYREVLARLSARGWTGERPRPRLSAADKLRVVLRARRTGKGTGSAPAPGPAPSPAPGAAPAPAEGRAA